MNGMGASSVGGGAPYRSISTDNYPWSAANAAGNWPMWFYRAGQQDFGMLKIRKAAMNKIKLIALLCVAGAGILVFGLSQSSAFGDGQAARCIADLCSEMLGEGAVAVAKKDRQLAGAPAQHRQQSRRCP